MREPKRGEGDRERVMERQRQDHRKTAETERQRLGQTERERDRETGDQLILTIDPGSHFLCRQGGVCSLALPGDPQFSSS